jgi:hypothetical protein
MKPRQAAALALVLTLVGGLALYIMTGREKNSLLGLVAVMVFPLVFLIRLIVKLTAKTAPKSSDQIRPN